MKNHRVKYKKIDQELRHQIINKIINQGLPLKQVAQETNTNVSTCKAILKVYQEEGRVGKKQNRNKIVDVVETYSFYIIENGKLITLPSKQFDNVKVSMNPEDCPEQVLKEKCQQKAQKMMIEYEKNHKEEEPVSKQQSQQNYNPYGFYGYPPPPPPPPFY